MKTIAATLIFVSLNAFSQESYTKTVNSRYYEFTINYWFNMHHFLWNEAFLNQEADSSMVKNALTQTQQKSLEESLAYYKEELVEKDLRTDEYMEDFKVWITKVDTLPSAIPDRFEEHIAVLQLFNKTYREVFWEAQLAVSEAAIETNMELIRSTEEDYWDQILEATRGLILDDTIKVDVVYLGKATKWNLRNRPYTSIFPTRVVMNTHGHDDIEGEWLELLYHESAHALILSSSGFVAGTILDVAQNADLEIPRQLSHAYLFYMTGWISQQVLRSQGVDYPTTYMVNKNVFSRYHDALRNLDDYMRKKKTLASVTELILKDLND